MTLAEWAQLLGNIGEFVGAIAVVATLAYLSVQIRQNSRVVEAATSNSVTRSRNELNMLLATHQEFSEVLLAGHQDYESLNREQRQRFNAYIFAMLNSHEDQYIHELKGFAAPGQWESARDFLTAFFSNENMKHWWKVRGAPVVGYQFRLEMQNNLGM